MKKKSSSPRSPWLTIGLMVSPLFILAALIGLFIKGGALDMEKAKASNRDRAARLDAVSKSLAGSGTVIRESSPGVAIVTLPSGVAMEANAVQAKELALTTRSRLGGIVRVETPAGQVLAEAP